MGKIAELIDSLKAQILASKYDIGPFMNNGTIVTTNMVNSENYIDNMLLIRRALCDTLQLVDSKMRFAVERHQMQIPAINKALTQMHAGPVQKEPEFVPNNNELYEDPEEMQTVLCARTARVLETPIYVEGTSVTINAVLVQSTADVRPDNRLYYVEPINHFAIYIAGHLFHGNIGNIFINNTEPMKVQTCRFGRACGRGNKCTFYHDPLIAAAREMTTRDVRNYTKHSMTYETGVYYGSRHALETDLAKMSDAEERQRYYDMTTHMLLCAILLKQKKDPNL